MAAITGAGTSAAFKISSAWGTAVTVGANNKYRGEISPNFNVETLQPKMVGSGLHAADSAVIGNFKPTVALSADAYYNGTLQYVIAQFLGTSPAPTEQTASQADYKHTTTFNTTLNAKYGTFAYETSSTSIIELPSVACDSLTISLDDAPGILSWTANLLGNTALVSGATNNNAGLQAATQTDTEVIAYDMVDTFRMNSSSGGSLSGSDQKNIRSLTLTLQRPQEIVGEIRGNTGNGAPRGAGLFTGTLSITLKELPDNTEFTTWGAGTAQKCSLNIQGSQIGSGVNKAISMHIPKMVMVTEPQYSVTSDGINEVTLTYQIIKASTNPTGMSSTYPYFEFINGLSSSLLA